MKRKWVGRGVAMVALSALVFTAVGAVVNQLWNWLMPPLFGWHTISFWQALGVLVLSRLLFGGLRGPSGRGMHWRGRMKDRWQKMTPEEREQFRHGMRHRCGGLDKAATESTAS